MSSASAIPEAAGRAWEAIRRAMPAAMVVLLAAVILALIVMLPGQEEPVTPPPLRFDSTMHVNSQAGYSFRYPPPWSLSERATVSEVVSPSGDIVVSFGLGAEGALRDASDRLVASLLETYEQSELIGRETREVGGHSAMLVSGVGTNDSGIRVRFLAITVAADRVNYAIAVFTAADADPNVVLPIVERVVNSFRPQA
jgi:hypothetical protein